MNTTNIDEMQNILTAVYDVRSFDAPDDQSLFHARAAYFNFGAIDLSFGSYNTPFSVEFRNDDFFRVQVCVSGSGRTSSGRSTADVDPTVVVCSTANTVCEFGPSYEQLVLRADRLTLERDLTTLLGSRPKDQISFDLSTSCDAAQTRRLREKIIYTASWIDISREPIPPPLLREMEQTIRLAVIYGIPNNFTDRLMATPKTAAPWQVRRVEDWIDAHWQQSITIETLVEISGASLRSIFATFKSARGYTPMAYLKQVRLNAAREMLLKAEPGASVTGIAFACNFLNSSHFARDYERQFGELPSETLRQGKTNRS